MKNEAENENVDEAMKANGPIMERWNRTEHRYSSDYDVRLPSSVNHT